jgi:hypothetical protein
MPNKKDFGEPADDEWIWIDGLSTATNIGRCSYGRRGGFSGLKIFPLKPFLATNQGVRCEKCTETLPIHEPMGFTKSRR